MKTHDFYFDLPQELIAQTPLQRRDASRLLVLDKETGAWGHRHLYELPELLRPGDCLILNDSRVLLLIDRGDNVWECLVRPGRKLRPGAKVSFGEELTVEIEGEAAVKDMSAWRTFFHSTATSAGKRPMRAARQLGRRWSGRCRSSRPAEAETMFPPSAA